MYLPSHFDEQRPALLHAVLRQHPLGLLITQSTTGELAANPIPFLLDVDPDGGPGILRGHVARANPVWQEARTDSDALVVFQGPQTYISPSLYPSKVDTGKAVPTWNYIMVQARGRVTVIDDGDWLHAFVTRLTTQHETTRAAPWAVSDAPPDYVKSMLRAVVGIEIKLRTLQGKWKVSQNRSRADQDGVIAGLQSQGGEDAGALAAALAAFK